jgi:hypothetical protein
MMYFCWLCEQMNLSKVRGTVRVNSYTIHVYLKAARQLSFTRVANAWLGLSREESL